jgi:plasmid stabilization system protein ParE
VASRTRSVVWTPLARDGLDDVLAYIAEDSAEAAEKVLEVVLGVAESLSVFSERGASLQPLTSVFCLYEVLPSEVRILTFIHGARDFDRWLRSL